MGSIYGDGGRIDLEIRIQKGIGGICHHRHLGHPTGQCFIRKGVYRYRYGLTHCHPLYRRLMDIHLHRHCAHIGNGQNRLPLAHGRTFLYRFLTTTTITHGILIGSTIDHQPRALSMDGCEFYLLLNIRQLHPLQIELAFSRAEASGLLCLLRHVLFNLALIPHEGVFEI